jgi:Subtilase family
VESNDINCPPINTHGPLGWWHHVHGINAADQQRGAGLRIGVIDESLPPEMSLLHVRRLGRIYRSNIYEDNNSCTNHGLAVCGLVAARINGTDGFEGIAPGAEVLFLSARSDVDPKKLNPQSVAAAIRSLALQHSVTLFL